MPKSGLIISTDLVLPDAEQLVVYGGMSNGTARILTKKEMPSGLVAANVPDLPAQFAGAVILGVDGKPARKPELSASFVDASGGLVIAATDDQVKAIRTGAPVIVAKPGG